MSSQSCPIFFIIYLHNEDNVICVDREIKNGILRTLFDEDLAYLITVVEYQCLCPFE